MADFKYNIFDILSKLDNQQYDYFMTLSEDELKYVQPYVVMKWLATLPKGDKIAQAAKLLQVNSTMNVNHWNYSVDKRLQLLSMVCHNGTQYHSYPKKTTKENVKKDKKKEWLRKYKFELTNEEFEDWYSELTKADLLNYLVATGYID